ncbi:MAG: helical backbone metal receptor [Bacteroidetes bacterium]|nr:helical backbone metal receptor [Bacteroidota bacterium]
MPHYTDPTGHSIYLSASPQRIISLVPSQTEFLYDLGLRDEVVGITKFCIHPDQWFRNKTRVGGTKQIRMETIHALQPDLILANKEENVKEQVEALQQHYPVWTSDINTPEEALDMIREVGIITGREQPALSLIREIEQAFNSLIIQERRKTCYLIWKDPYMSVGGDTFIHGMMKAAGFDNMLIDSTRYPALTLAELQLLAPECLLLSSEPFPFKEKHCTELEKVLPGTQVLLVDGEMFSWYGSRMREAPAYFQQLQTYLK